MSSNENPPSLALSDIMHHMSPSPVPLEELHVAGTTNLNEGRQRNNRAAFFDPINELDMLNIRRRLEEMGLLATSQRNGPEGNETLSGPSIIAGNASSREKELVDMILRLTDSLPVDPAQLEQQATSIARLTAQRDFLVAQAEEERAWWRSERESWDRTAEALLSQRNKPPKSEEADRQRVAFETENRALRDKLHDTQRRLSMLETELLRLKPLLLMQPYSTSRLKQSIGPHMQSNNPISDRDKGKRREVDSAPSRHTLRPISEDYENSGERAHHGQTSSSSPHKADQHPYAYNYHYHGASTSSSLHTPRPPVNPPITSSPGPGASSSSKAHSAHVQTHPIPQPSPQQQQRRRSRDQTNAPDTSKSHSKRQTHHSTTPLSSDAYTEHVLLAAQRIGRKRAAIVTGLQQYAEREKEAFTREQEQMRSHRDQERLEKERLERLASGTSGMAYYRPTTEGGMTSPQRGGAPRTGGPAMSTMPRTPKRSLHPTHYPALSIGPNNNANPGGVNTPPPSTYVFVNTSATPGAKGPVYGTSGILGTPAHLGAPVNIGPGRPSQKNLPSNPPTPLDSLLNAARSMMDDGGDGKTGGGKTNGRRRPLEEPESPVPKRRRISTDKTAAKGGGGGRLDRVKSALDVLADQAAAAFNEPGPSKRRDSVVSGSSVIAKGKAKAKEKERNSRSVSDEEDSQDTRELGPEEMDVHAHENVTVSSRGRVITRGSTRAKRGSATASASSRPVRQTSRKRAVSPDNVTSISTSTRGTGRPRGRPKSIATKRRREASDASSATPRMISPPGPGPRVIAAPSGYSPLDEAIAMAPAMQARDIQGERGHSEERLQHPHVTSAVDRPRNVVPHLRPVAGWRERQDANNGDANSSSLLTTIENGENEHSSEVRGASEHPISSPILPPPNPTLLSEPSPPPVAHHELPTDSGNRFSQTDLMPIASPSGSSNNAHTENKSPTPSRFIPPTTDVEMTTPSPEDPDPDVDAEAEPDVDEDQDAEGEQEDEDEDENEAEDAEVEVGSRNHPSRSRSPPPPDPPPPGPDNGPPPDADDEHDADADAEGEMEFDETEEPPPSNYLSSTGHQAAHGLKVTPNELLSSEIPYLLEYGCGLLPPVFTRFSLVSGIIFPIDFNPKVSRRHLPRVSHYRRQSPAIIFPRAFEAPGAKFFYSILGNETSYPNTVARWKTCRMRRNESQYLLPKRRPRVTHVKWSKGMSEVRALFSGTDAPKL